VAQTKRKAAERFRFTVDRLARVTVPDGADRVYVYDAERQHLAFCLTTGGSRSFYVYKRVAGRPVRMKLGDYPTISIETARKLEAVNANDIAAGKDPMEQRRQARAEITFAEVFQRYLEGHAKLKKRTWKEDEQKFEKHLGQLKSRRFKTITSADITAVHTRIGKTHKGAANRVLALLSKVFRYAAGAMDMKIPNPCSGIERFAENERARFLEPEEIKPFMDALEAETDQTYKDYFMTLLLTGARAGNVAAMRWAEIHFDRMVWEIPATKYKGKFAHTVTLDSRAIEILTRRKLKAGKCEWVFPSTGKRKSTSGHLVRAHEAWKDLLERAGISDFNLHDLRRSLASYMAMSGTGLPIIGRQLGHRAESTTRRYARLHLDPVRTSVAAALQAMEAVKATADLAAAKAGAK